MGGATLGPMSPAEPDPSEGDGGGGSLLCGEFDISEGWDESDVPGLHACLFDSVKGAGSGGSSVRQGHDGDETVRSSACGDVDVEFVDEFVDSDPFGFSRRVRIVYFVHLTCEDGTPAVAFRRGRRWWWARGRVRARMIVRWCAARAIRGYRRRRRAGACPTIFTATRWQRTGST